MSNASCAPFRRWSPPLQRETKNTDGQCAQRSSEHGRSGGGKGRGSRLSSGRSHDAESDPPGLAGWVTSTTAGDRAAIVHADLRFRLEMHPYLARQARGHFFLKRHCSVQAGPL